LIQLKTEEITIKSFLSGTKQYLRHKKSEAKYDPHKILSFCHTS